MAFSTRTMQPEDWATLKHFTAAEFNYPDAMGFEFMQWLDKLRTALRFPIKISSDHRPPERNAAAGGKSRSAHLDIPCEAVDISSASLDNAKRFKLVHTAMALGCRRMGLYENGSVHLDRAEGKGKAQDVLWVKL